MGTIKRRTHYTKLDWENNKTPLNADNLNRIEDGVAGAIQTLIDYEGIELGSQVLNSHIDDEGTLVKNTASGENSTAAGTGTLATTKSQFVVGEYNQESDALFIVGGGSGDNEDERKNLMEVGKDATKIDELVVNSHIYGPTYNSTDISGENGGNLLVNVDTLNSNIDPIKEDIGTLETTKLNRPTIEEGYDIDATWHTCAIPLHQDTIDGDVYIAFNSFGDATTIQLHEYDAKYTDEDGNVSMSQRATTSDGTSRIELDVGTLETGKYYNLTNLEEANFGVVFDFSAYKSVKLEYTGIVVDARDLNGDETGVDISYKILVKNKTNIVPIVITYEDDTAITYNLVAVEQE